MQPIFFDNLQIVRLLGMQLMTHLLNSSTEDMSQTHDLQNHYVREFICGFKSIDVAEIRELSQTVISTISTTHEGCSGSLLISEQGEAIGVNNGSWWNHNQGQALVNITGSRALRQYQYSVPEARPSTIHRNRNVALSFQHPAFNYWVQQTLGNNPNESTLDFLQPPAHLVPAHTTAVPRVHRKKIGKAKGKTANPLRKATANPLRKATANLRKKATANPSKKGTRKKASSSKKRGSN